MQHIIYSFANFFQYFLFYLVQSQNKGNVLELMKPLFLIFWSFAVTFLICNFGEDVTTKFIMCDRAMYECQWYRFPNEVQKMLPIIMISTQSPLIFRGFANVFCTRETFKRVANGGFSYFTVLRQIKWDKFWSFELVWPFNFVFFFFLQITKTI